MKRWGALAVACAMAGCAGTDSKPGPGDEPFVDEAPPATEPSRVGELPGEPQLATAVFVATPATGQAVSPSLTAPTVTAVKPTFPSEDATPELATSSHWTFLTSSSGLPPRIYGVSADEGGNLWVAGGNAGVYVLKAGETLFRQFGTPYPAISISGGPAGTAFVGYMGLPDCDMAWDTGGTADVYKSGDADRVWLQGDSLLRSHYDIYSGPGVVAAEPQGREKLCNIFRILYDGKTQSVWFGGNHGVAWGDPASSKVVEHTHPAINGYMTTAGGGLHYTLLSGDYMGLATDARGNLWMGGRERSAMLPYADNGGDFWSGDTSVQQHKIDVWPDAVPEDPTPSQAVLDNTFGFAPMPDGSVWAGSETEGLAWIGPDGKPGAHFVKPLIDKSITAMAADNESVWAGHGGVSGKGGLTRIVGTRWIHYGAQALGSWASSKVSDIQVQKSGPDGKRRVLVGFYSGAIGIYDGD